MNPITLNAIKLFSELLKETDSTEIKASAKKILDQLIHICAVEVEEAYKKYSSIVQ